MLLILEGPDGSGKSSLARSLDTELHHRNNDPRRVTVDIIHCGPIKAHPVMEYVVPLLHYQPSYKHHVIADRLHLGECVYPVIMNRESLMDGAVLDHIETFLRSRGALVVHVTSTLAELDARITVRGDDYVKPSQLDRIWKAFYLVMDGVTTLPVITVQPGIEPLDEIMERILYQAAIETGGVIK